MAIFAAVPFNLTNGSLADATQVMANFNQLVANGNANAAPLASPAFSGTVTMPDAGTWAGTGIANVVSVGVNVAAPGTGLVNPQVGIVGVTTNSNAAAGQVGEYKSTIVLVGSAISSPNNTPTAIATLALTAGDWDVWGELWFAISASPTSLQAAITTTSGGLPVAPADNVSYTTVTIGGGGNISAILPLKPNRQSLAGNTNIFLNSFALYPAGAVSGYGIIAARRVR